MREKLPFLGYRLAFHHQRLAGTLLRLKFSSLNELRTHCIPERNRIGKAELKTANRNTSVGYPASFPADFRA